MRWELKASIARWCARLPFGDALYRQGQRRLGRVRADPRQRLAVQAEMCRWLLACGAPIAGRRLFEVGTGHLPVVPIGFYLAGAAGTITVDLHPRLSWSLLRSTLHWIAANRAHVERLYEEVVPGPLLGERWSTLARLRDDPRAFLRAAGIEYLAPQDAARTPLRPRSIDCHFSVTVLEHIPGPVLRDIFREARRVLTPDGLAIHFVDPSDHFAHQDGSITAINFLRYSDEAWRDLADNRFAYCNRLRASDHLRLMREVGFDVARLERVVDERAREALRGGFPLDRRFAQYEPDDLCTTSLKVLLRPDGRET